MAPALPQPQPTIDTGAQPCDVGAAVMAPALPQPQPTIESGGQPIGAAQTGLAHAPWSIAEIHGHPSRLHWHLPATGLGRSAVSSWALG
jgi:hypothetical protein